MEPDDERSQRLQTLTETEPAELTSMERGELRARLRDASPHERTAITRSLALAEAARNPKSPYARGAARAATHDHGRFGVRYQ